MYWHFQRLIRESINPLSANFTKWPNSLKQFIGNLSTNCLSVFGHFVKLAIKQTSSNQTSSFSSLNTCYNLLKSFWEELYFNGKNVYIVTCGLRVGKCSNQHWQRCCGNMVFKNYLKL